MYRIPIAMNMNKKETNVVLLKNSRRWRVRGKIYVMMLHRIIIIIITRITYRYKHIHKCNLVKTRNYCHLHGCDQQLKKACNKNKTFCTIEETRAKLNGHKPCLKIMGKIKIHNSTLHLYTY